MSNTIKHIAFIMDGNGRWATKKNKPRIFGHNEGVKRISEIIEGCIEHNIKYMSFFCFSTENWDRPRTEINFLINQLHKSLSQKNLKWFHEHKIKVNFIGFKENLTDKVYEDVVNFCRSTNIPNHEYVVNFCFNYGSRKEILYACKNLLEKKLEINEQNFNSCLMTNESPDIDLLIRTSGEQRISNFMLWQISYAEIIFESKYWPEYTKDVLNNNINIYMHRIRRFGKIK